MRSRFLPGASVLLLLAALAAQGTAMAPAPELPPPLRTVAVPQPSHLDEYVADRQAAIRLGKALFWDMQVGSDGIQACGSCHFHAGADSRLKNQLNPDLNGPAPAFTPPDGPNCTMTAGEFPFHLLASPDDPTSVLADRRDVVASQGVFHTKFLAVVPGSAVEQVAPLPDPVFNVAGLNTRRVEPRNAPTVINAIFNHRNFWDGRAQGDFNGVNPFGARDAGARILKVDRATGTPALVQCDLSEGASLASLSCGPPLSPFEMSAEGRTMRDLGRKLLTLRPLGRQLVAPNDSVLGPLSRVRPGLSTTYRKLIQAAFRPQWWRSRVMVTFDAHGHPRFDAPSGEDARETAKARAGDKGKAKATAHDGHPAREEQESGEPGDEGDELRSPGQYTVMEANFSLFFGLSVQLYLATLVSDETPLDRFLEGHLGAMTAQQEAGMRLFFGKAGCARCHTGPELTEASFRECAHERIDELTNLIGIEAKYDKGFLNTGVRPAPEDRGIGGLDPFGAPLADTRRLQMGLVPTGAFNLPVGPLEPVAVDGAFKIPGLRNVELTAPYFHNGGAATLEQVVEFYNRGGDFARHDPRLVRDFMRPLGLTPGEKAALVAFLKALTDERVRYEKAPFDHPQLFVPNGHPGDQYHVPGDGTGQARDDLMEIKAVGAGGGPPLLPVF